MRGLRLCVFVALCGASAVMASPAALGPSSFATSARFSVDADEFPLSTAIATIEPRPSAPGYSWVRIHFYSFAPAGEDMAAIGAGNVDAMDKKWEKKASVPADYNHGYASIQLSVDSAFKVWQVDMAIPGHTCSIAPFEDDVHNFLQDYHLDGKTLTLKSKGSYVCDMMSGKQRLGWDIDVQTPVFAKAKRRDS